MIPSLNRIEISVKGATSVLLVVKGLRSVYILYLQLLFNPFHSKSQIFLLGNCWLVVFKSLCSSYSVFLSSEKCITSPILKSGRTVDWAMVKIWIHTNLFFFCLYKFKSSYLRFENEYNVLFCSFFSYIYFLSKHVFNIHYSSSMNEYVTIKWTLLVCPVRKTKFSSVPEKYPPPLFE